MSLRPYSPQLCSLTRLLGACFLLLIASTPAQSIPLQEYHSKVRQAVVALDSLAQIDENEDASAFNSRLVETVQGVRMLVPRTVIVEWGGSNITADNSWLHQELDKYSDAPLRARAEILRRMTERLKALEERLAEGDRATWDGNKTDAKRKLTEILQRPEFASKANQQSAIARLLEQFIKWLQNLFPKPKTISPGSAGIFSLIAQIFVIALAVAVLVFVARMFLPRLLRSRKQKKKAKVQARIVLGEKLAPDQSAGDLLSEAEALARRGELRAAIRKAYIALLVELGDRKIISLAQHKTNRDYLRSVRDVQPLYGNVEQLTDKFERHWYGLAQATETDWRAFRTVYEQTLRQ